MPTDHPGEAGIPSDAQLDLEAAVYALDLARGELAQARASARCLETAVTAAHLGYLTLDLRTGHATADARCARLLGYSAKGQMTTLGWFADLVHPDDRPRLMLAWQAHVAGQTRECDLECRLRTSEGGWRSVVFRAGVVERAADGAPLQLAGTVRDLRERGAGDPDLVASELRYRRLFETAQDGILLLDAGSAEILDANPFIVDLLGYPYTEIVGRKLWEVGAFVDAAASEAGFRELQRAGYVRYENLPLEARGGRRIHVEFVSNLYQVDGQPIIQCNVRDISARRRAEDALANLRARLEALVEERTAELAQANAALRQEMGERERAEERERSLLVVERTRMAREIHDTLAQGLVGIIIQLEAAEDALTGGPAGETLAAAQAHMYRARELARESLSEARRSVWALRPRVLEQADLFSALVQMVHGRALAESVEVEFACLGNPRVLAPGVEDDLLRIAQEAVSNTIRHAGARRIRIALAYAAEQVEVSIEDDGRGFEPSAEDTRQGFGMRSMRERAERMGGHLEVSSRSGAGVVVRVVAPAPPREEVADG